MIKIVNPTNVDISEFNFNGKLYTIKANSETVVANDSAAEYICSIYGFLKQSVVSQNVDSNVENDSPIFKCPKCEYQNRTKIAVFAHMRKHHPGETEKIIEIIPKEKFIEIEKEAEVGEQPTGIGSFFTGKRSVISESSLDGTGKDKDGYEWVGSGLEEDSIE